MMTTFAMSERIQRAIKTARAGDRAGARQALEQTLREEGEHVDGLMWLAWTQDSVDAACENLDRALSLDPQHALARLGAAWLRGLRDSVVEQPVEPTYSDGFVASVPDPMISEVSPTTSGSDNSTIVPEPAPVSEFSTGPMSFSETLPDPLVQPTTTDANAYAEPALAAQPAPIPMPPVEPVNYGVGVPTTTKPVSDDFFNEPEPEPVAPPPAAPMASSVTAPRAVKLDDPFADGSGVSAEWEEQKQEDARRTILVVDDSATVCKIVSLTLEKRGHKVIFAVDGVAAMSVIGETRPDLILLDITMPRMDGYQLCKLIKGYEATKSIPVVMLSGKDGFFDKVRGRLVGCADYITKPFDPDVLVKKVESYLGLANAGK